MVFVAVACPILLMLVCCCLFPLNQAGGEQSKSSAIDWRNAVDWRNNAPSAVTAAKSVRAPLVRLAAGSRGTGLLQLRVMHTRSRCWQSRHACLTGRDQPPCGPLSAE